MVQRYLKIPQDQMPRELDATDGLAAALLPPTSSPPLPYAPPQRAPRRTGQTSSSRIPPASRAEEIAPHPHPLPREHHQLCAQSARAKQSRTIPSYTYASYHTLRKGWCDQYWSMI